MELLERGLITKSSIGRRNVYTISESVYFAIDKANGKDRNISELQDMSPYGDAVGNEEIEVLTIATDTDVIQPEYGEIATYGDAKYHQQVLPNKIKETKLITNTNKIEKEQNSQNRNFRVRTEKSFPTTGKTTSLSVVNEFYQTLTESDKKSFDIAARDMVLPGEAIPGGKIQLVRTARLRFYELLKQEPKRHDGFELYNVSPDEMDPSSELRGLLN